MQPNTCSDDSVAVQEGRVVQAGIREKLVVGSIGEGGVRPLDPIRFWGQGNKLLNFYSCMIEVYGQEFSSRGKGGGQNPSYECGARSEMGGVKGVWEKR